MARKRRRKKSRANYVYGRDFAGHTKAKKSLIWSDSASETKKWRKDSLL